MKKGIIVSLIAALLLSTILGAVPAAVLVASAGESTTFRHCEHPRDHRLGMGNSTSNGLLNWRYTARGDVISSLTVANKIVYIGSWNGSVYALQCNNWDKDMELHNWKSYVLLLPYSRQRNCLRGQQ